MGKLACHCGHMISDSTYPCSWAGELKWETESELQSQKIYEDVTEFLLSVENGKNIEWISNYFNESYPNDLNVASIIDDIYSKNLNEQGHNVLQCSECERLYIQKEFYTNEWVCFEKRT